MTDTKAAIEQFAALFAAVRKLAEIEDVDKAAADARAQLKKAQDELEHYLAQRDRQAKAQNAEGEAELDRKRKDNDKAIAVAKDVHDKYFADEERKLHLAREKLQTERDTWARTQGSRAAAAGQADELLNRKRAETAEQNQLLTAVREEVAAEQKKLEETRKALQTLQRVLGAAPFAA
jgi:hypothetical protein